MNISSILTFFSSCVVLWQGVNCAFENEEVPEYFYRNNNSRLSEDGRLSFRGLAAKYGHPAEKISIITEDGYNLTLYHMEGDPNKVVLLVHGLAASSDCWIARGETSLSITLADQGYDVWAINMRGCYESREHICIDPVLESDRFFNYTFYEQGYYDLPATIDYILENTNQTQLLAVGHSLGTTAFYIMGAERPEYNEKIKAFISLAPMCYLQHLRGLLAGEQISLSPIILGTAVGFAEYFGTNQQVKSILTSCFGNLGYRVCQKTFSKLYGPDEDGLEREFSPTFIGHYPDGSNTKTIEHLAQIKKRDEFARFDYGNGNLVAYESTEPPKINLTKVTMKVALLVGKGDYLSSVEDVVRLSKMLPNVIHHQVLPYENFNHLDFVFGRHMPDTLYPYLLELIRTYSQ